VTGKRFSRSGNWPVLLAETHRPRPLLRDVVAYPLILMARGTSVRTFVDRALEKEELEITVACEAN
jgi:hypothetical protein